MSSVVQTILPLLRAEMGSMKIPRPSDRVHKDECLLSFDSPYSENGLFVNLVTYQGFGKDYLKFDKSGAANKFYLQEIWRQVPVEKVSTNAGEKSVDEVPTKVAIGVSGGFVTEAQFEVVKTHSLYTVCADGSTHSLALPCSELPEFVSTVIQGIIDHAGMKSNMQASSWEAENEKFVSKYAENMVQMNPTGKKISQDPSTWVDEETGEAGNLWLNLATGYIGGGRQNWDGTGGSGSALRHYEETGRQYPLVVKLGTITPHGADVWSYAPEEDNAVLDPKLAEHLSFWGIDIMKLEKTEKTLGEMEVDLNMSYDWSRIMEGGEQLEPRSGPGLVGLTNIGSSCYLNSIMQCMMAMPEVQRRYLDKHAEIVASAPFDASADFMSQMSKLAVALASDRYVPPAEEVAAVLAATRETTAGVVVEGARDERYNIAPRMLKFLVAKGHNEFASSRQQDASEYFMHLLEVMSKAERTGLNRIDPSGNAKPTRSVFEFHLQSCMCDAANGWYRYNKLGPQTLNSVLELRIPLEFGVTTVSPEKEETAEKKPRVERGADVPPDANTTVEFQYCLNTVFESETIDARLHPTLGASPCTQTTRFRNFPRYLMVKLGRYTAGENWVQVKINAKVPVPEHLDLSMLRGSGLQDGQQEPPEEAESAGAGGGGGGGGGAAQVQQGPSAPDETLVAELVAMGFSLNGCRRAAVATRNSGVESAMNWVLEHMEDADFNDPLPAAGSAAVDSAMATAAAVPAVGAGAVDPEAMLMLGSMGYTERQVQGALKATDNNIERAADWLFSHMDDLDGSVEAVLAGGDSLAAGSGAGAGASEETILASVDDGEGKYSLMAVVSHIGKNTDHGHYVCHIKKHGEWVLFNDEKVGKSSAAPLEHGFMYLFRRDDAPQSI